MILTKKELDFILQQGEGLKIEFKESLKNIDKDIVALANAEGGRIFLGISDDNKIKGINTTNKLKSAIQDISNNCDPAIKVNIGGFEDILIIDVNEGDNKPYKCSSGFYMRQGPNSQKMSRDEIIKLIQQTNKVKFDETICKDATLKDIDRNKLKLFLMTARNERNLGINPNLSTKESLTRLNLMVKNKLINAAILMFGKRPQKFFLQSRIRCARFKGTKPLDFIDMKVLEGTIPELKENATKFIMQNIKHAVYFDANRRYDKWEYPLRALEEAITNALAHRDYYSDAEIQLSIFDDRIEIWNPGELPKPLTVDDLKKEHQSIPRNKLIADSLFLIKYIERWGTGTNRIVEEMLKNKLPEPIFLSRAGSFIVKLIGPKEEFKRFEEKEYAIMKSLNKRQKKALDFIKNQKEITRKEYMKINNVSNKTAYIELNNLVKKGILTIVGKGRATKYVFR